MTRLKYFYINLDRDEHRRYDIEREAKKIGINFERFPAFLGSNIPEDLKPLFRKYQQRLSQGEIGCYASHLALCKKLLADKESDYYAIFEDDIAFDINFDNLIKNIFNHSKVKWDRLHLAGHAKFSMLVVEQLQNFCLVKYSKIPTNGAGYIISKSGADKFLKYRNIRRALDHDFQRDWQFNIVTIGVHPRPITQKGNVISSIDSIDPRIRTISYKLFIDTPIDIFRSNIHLIREIGIIDYLIMGYLNILIELYRRFFKKRINFLKSFKKIEKFNL